jgi:hypothetical protein
LSQPTVALLKALAGLSVGFFNLDLCLWRRKERGAVGGARSAELRMEVFRLTERPAHELRACDALLIASRRKREVSVTPVFTCVLADHRAKGAAHLTASHIHMKLIARAPLNSTEGVAQRELHFLACGGVKQGNHGEHLTLMRMIDQRCGRRSMELIALHEGAELPLKSPQPFS